MPAQAPWYKDGLSFACTRCGACCTGAPGYVWVDLEQIEALAQFVGKERDEFSKAYVRRVGKRYSLVEKPGGDCIFWDRETGCTVYEARPIQCRTWPFWNENIESPDAWKQVQKGCPGAGQGPLFPLEEIEAAARRTPS